MFDIYLPPITSIWNAILLHACCGTLNIDSGIQKYTIQIALRKMCCKMMPLWRGDQFFPFPIFPLNNPLVAPFPKTAPWVEPFCQICPKKWNRLYFGTILDIFFIWPFLSCFQIGAKWRHFSTTSGAILNFFSAKMASLVESKRLHITRWSFFGPFYTKTAPPLKLVPK